MGNSYKLQMKQLSFHRYYGSSLNACSGSMEGSIFLLPRSAVVPPQTASKLGIIVLELLKNVCKRNSLDHFGSFYFTFFLIQVDLELCCYCLGKVGEGAAAPVMGGVGSWHTGFPADHRQFPHLLCGSDDITWLVLIPLRVLGTIARAWWKPQGRVCARGQHVSSSRGLQSHRGFGGRYLAVFITDHSRKTLAGLGLAAESAVTRCSLSWSVFFFWASVYIDVKLF